MPWWRAPHHVAAQCRRGGADKAQGAPGPQRQTAAAGAAAREPMTARRSTAASPSGRSEDRAGALGALDGLARMVGACVPVDQQAQEEPTGDEDRKSTRLNSSHVAISYAVFCLKKKN